MLTISQYTKKKETKNSDCVVNLASSNLSRYCKKFRFIKVRHHSKQRPKISIVPTSLYYTALSSRTSFRLAPAHTHTPTYTSVSQSRSDRRSNTKTSQLPELLYNLKSYLYGAQISVRLLDNSGRGTLITPSAYRACAF